jgi:hypothetical protein
MTVLDGMNLFSVHDQTTYKRVEDVLFNGVKDKVINKGFRYIEGYRKVMKKLKVVYQLHAIKEKLQLMEPDPLLQGETVLKRPNNLMCDTIITIITITIDNNSNMNIPVRKRA